MSLLSPLAYRCQSLWLKSCALVLLGMPMGSLFALLLALSSLIILGPFHFGFHLVIVFLLCYPVPHLVHPILMSGESVRGKSAHKRQSVFNSSRQCAGPPNLEKELCFPAVPLFVPISNSQQVKQHVYTKTYLH